METPNIRKRYELFPLALNLRFPLLPVRPDLLDISYYIEPSLVIIPEILVLSQFRNYVVSTIAYPIRNVK